MRISQSSLSMQGQSLSVAQQQIADRLEFTIRHPELQPPTEKVTLSQEALAAAQPAPVTDKNAPTSGLDLRLQLLIDIVEQLTGHKVQVFDPASMNEKPSADAAETQQAVPEETAAQAERQPALEWSLHFEHKEVHEESQATRFQASGSVKTADGREIEFSVDLQMARYARSESTTTLDAGNMRRKDPLVLNLNGGPASLLSDRVSFDLDGKGSADSIARLGSGSLFLAMDRNQNGKIDNGTELFGPNSGDGFGELAQLDSDGKGWIDEADSAYKSLSVWRPGEAAQSLAKAGVGAIALQNVNTPFSLRADQANAASELGAIQSTGVFLHEDGTPGTIQHVDLSV